MSWLAIFLILFAGALSGWLIIAQFLLPGSESNKTNDRPAGVELLFAGVIIGLAFMGWLALTLAQLSVFSGRLLVALWLLLVLALALRRRTWQATRATLATMGRPTRRSVLEWLILTGWLAAAGWLFFRPHEYILGGADAGVYVNQAANIAQTGRIVFEDPFVAELEPELRPVFLREQPAGLGTTYYLFPAFNVSDEQPGQIIPDFYPLHPVWQAVAYDLGGVWAALRLPGLWALLGSLAVYFTLRQVVGWPLALLGLAGMSLNALQVWFARYPVAETLTGFLLWASLWALGAWLDRRLPGKLWALIAAVTLGELFLVRIDTLFLLAIPFLLAMWLLLARPGFSRSEAAWYFLPLFTLVAQAMAHALFISTPYAGRIFNYVSRTLASIGLAIPVLIGLLLIVTILILGIRFRTKIASWWPRWWHRFRRPALVISSTALLLLTAYGWFVRPALGAAGGYEDWWGGSTIFLYDHENLVRLGWYLSPMGVWLGATGAILLLWRGNRRTIAIVGVGLFFSLLYLWRIQINQHQIYAMRRYVPVVMPFFVFAATFVLAELLRHRRRWVQASGIVLTVVWLLGLGWSARGFVNQVDFPGVINELEAIDAGLPADSILLFDDRSPVSAGDIVGTPLRFLHGHDVLTVREPERADAHMLPRAIQNWQAAGRAVYWIGDAAFLDSNGFSYESEIVTIPVTFLELPYDHKPTQIVTDTWSFHFHALQPAGDP